MKYLFHHLGVTKKIFPAHGCLGVELGKAPGAVITPAKDYPFSSLITLGEQGTVEHVGIDNRAIPLSQKHCRPTGLILETPWTQLNHIALSTTLDLCLPENSSAAIGELPNAPLPSPEEAGMTTSNTSSGSGYNQQEEQPDRRGGKGASSVSTLYRWFVRNQGKGDDEDDPLGRKELTRSHYDEEYDWEKRYELLQSNHPSSTFENERRKNHERQYKRTNTVLMAGGLSFITGAVAGSLLVRRFGWTGILGPPRMDYHYYHDNGGFIHTIQCNWHYVVGGVIGLLAQGPITAFISIPKRRYIREQLGKKN